MIVTRPQLEKAREIIATKHDNAEKYIDYNLDYIKLYYHPETPESIYMKIRTHGIKSGMPFDDIKHLCINQDGEESNCATMFSNVKQKLDFYEDFREVELAGGHLKFKE